ncbi:MAG: STIV orfB116 family protein [Candidatus Nanopelagicaceae bacterium]
MKLGILNTTIATTNGCYEIHELSLEQAREIVGKAMKADGIDSAVGHQASSDILTVLLGVDVPMNRQQFAQQPQQGAIVLKLNGRIPEGAVLTEVSEIESIGYSLKLMVRLPDACNQPSKLMDLFEL